MQTLRWRILLKKTELKGIMQKLTLKVLCQNWADGYYVKTELKGITQKTELKGIMQQLSWRVWVLRKTWAEWYYAKPEVKGRPIEPNSDAEGLLADYRTHRAPVCLPIPEGDSPSTARQWKPAGAEPKPASAVTRFDVHEQRFLSDGTLEYKLR